MLRQILPFFMLLILCGCNDSQQSLAPRSLNLPAPVEPTRAVTAALAPAPVPAPAQPQTIVVQMPQMAPQPQPAAMLPQPAHSAALQSAPATTHTPVAPVHTPAPIPVPVTQTEPQQKPEHRVVEAPRVEPKKVESVKPEPKPAPVAPVTAVPHAAIRPAKTVAEIRHLTRTPIKSGQILVDGSSTVYPITKAAADEFNKVHPAVKIEVNLSGTGGGFKRFVKGETDISDASRPIKTKEVEAATLANVEFIELPVAYDGLSVVLNRNNTWCDSLTTAELKNMWKPDSPIKTWKDIRPEWPNEPILFFAPGTESGTFDFFTEVIVGDARKQRKDAISSENDEIIVQGVLKNPNSIGYFGLSYYQEHKDKLKLLAVDNGKGPVLPSAETVFSGTYQPLSRPLFIYVKKSALERPEMNAFVQFYMANCKTFVEAVDYIPLADSTYGLVMPLLQTRKTGSVFATAKPDASVDDVLTGKK